MSKMESVVEILASWQSFIHILNHENEYIFWHALLYSVLQTTSSTTV